MSRLGDHKGEEEFDLADKKFIKRDNMSGNAVVYQRNAPTNVSEPPGAQDLYYGVSTDDLIVSSNLSLAGQCGADRKGVYDYKNLTINQGSKMTITGNHAMIYVSGVLTINGVIEIVRSKGTTDGGSGGITCSNNIPGNEHNSRSAASRKQLNPGDIACSAGGGGGGGSGNTSCDGGFSGDHAVDLNGAVTAVRGGGGGTGGANSSGGSGGNAHNMSTTVHDMYTNAFKTYGWNNPTDGGVSTLSWTSGAATDTTSITQALSIPILMGGNGGPGGQSQDYSGYTAGRGGLGGGCLILFAPRIVFGSSGKVIANGQTGHRGTQGHFMGGPGGGGGGGMIALISPDQNTDVNTNCQVVGGAGGHNSNAGWPGSRNKGGTGGTGIIYKHTW